MASEILKDEKNLERFLFSLKKKHNLSCVFEFGRAIRE